MKNTNKLIHARFFENKDLHEIMKYPLLQEVDILDPSGRNPIGVNLLKGVTKCVVLLEEDLDGVRKVILIPILDLDNSFSIEDELDYFDIVHSALNHNIGQLKELGLYAEEI